MDTTIPDSQALQQGARLEEFVIERVLGSGGFGITYLAHDTSLGRQVVIKENLPTQFAWRETTTGTVRPRHSTGGDVDDFEWSMNNFLRESGTLASLDHPGIVRVLRQFSANGTAYFVMPFVAGVAFDSLIEDRKAKNEPFSEQELHGLIGRMLAALGYLHDRGIYHRDIKPANILITDDGIPVLIDFGAARQNISERSLTVVESPGYTPFEQLQSRGNIGPWSDLYALGATIAKAVTFETPPKAADRMMGDPWNGLAGSSLWAPSFSPEFLQAIDQSMAVDPRHRWQNAGEWVDSFRLGGKTPSANSPPPPIPQYSPGTAPRNSENLTGSATTKPKPLVLFGGSGPQPAADTAMPESSGSPQNRPWEIAYVASQCRHCAQRVRFQMKLLKKRIIKCIHCNKGVIPSSLNELHPEDSAPYLISLRELLLSYRGRVGRKEYWLLAVLPGLFLLIIGSMLIAGDVPSVGGLLIVAWIGWSLFVCIPITAKRLHDHDISGHAMWLLLIPYINVSVGIWFIIQLGAMPGKNTPNKFGPPVSLIVTPLG